MFTGESALFKAAERNYPGVAQLLLQWGADPKKKGNGWYKQTPADVAKSKGYHELGNWIDQQIQQPRPIAQVCRSTNSKQKEETAT